MNIKKTAKKIAALGASVGIMGISVASALAVDLQDYPDAFFTGGQFDGKIVVGANAAPQDILGAIDIAASLQAHSKVEVPVEGNAGQTIVTGDSRQIGDSSDILEIGEAIGSVTETLTDDDLQMLQGGRITTSKGSTDFTQDLDLDTSLTTGIVQLDENNDDETDFFLFFDDGQVFFNLDLEFTSGLESDVESSSADDLEDESIFMLGQYYSIVRATMNSSGGALVLEMIAGDVVDTLTEGETRTYTVDGKDYEVTVLVIGSSSSGGNQETNVKFLINGEVTDSMEDGDTDTLSDGLEIGVREIIETTAYREQDSGSVVEFYLGANKIEFESNGGGVEVNRENIEDATVTITYTETVTSGSGDISISSIDYQLESDAARSTDIYVGEGEGIRQFLDEPEGMLNTQWDILFAGLSEPTTTEIRFDPNGDDEYDFTFTNSRGDEYSMPYAIVTGATSMSFGDSDDEFIFWESYDKVRPTNTSLNDSSFNIEQDDYILLTDDDNDNKGDSYVLQWDDVDTDDQTISFTSAATGEEIEATYTTLYNAAANSVAITSLAPASASGDITVGGKDFNFWLRQVGGTGAYTLMVDMDDDGAIAGIDGGTSPENGASLTATTDIVNVVVRGGGLLRLSDEVPTPTGGTWEARLTTLAEDLDQDVAQVMNITFATTSSEFDLDLPADGSAADTDGTWYRQSLQDEDRDHGANAYGTFFDATDETDEADSLVIHYPSEQVEAIVYVVGGEVQTSFASGGVAHQVNPLPIGLAVLDTDVNVGDDNLIVVGGPCANSVAAELLGNPANCAEGFVDGMGMIRAFDTPGDTVAVLVAGSTARDTVETSYVLAQSMDYADDLIGDEVEVVTSGDEPLVRPASVSDDE